MPPAAVASFLAPPLLRRPCYLILPQEKFLRDNIQVKSAGGKKGNLGAAVKVERDGAKISVTSAEHPKRYIKYLAKKYLKQQSLRDYIHVIAVNKKESKGGYELRYFKLGSAAEE